MAQIIFLFSWVRTCSKSKPHFQGLQLVHRCFCNPLVEWCVAVSGYLAPFHLSEELEGHSHTTRHAILIVLAHVYSSCSLNLAFSALQSKYSHWAIPRHTPPTDDICPWGGRSGPRLSQGVEMLAVPGGLASFLACPRGFKSLFLVGQGGLGSSPACPRGVKMPCPRGLVADGKLSHGGPSLVNISQGG